MKLTIDTDNRLLKITDSGDEQVGERIIDLYSRSAFELISKAWLKVGWNQKYAYTFSWMGRPIIQIPEDMIRAQEVIYRVQPDVIVETGVAHGGSLVFYASLLKAMGKGRVIGVDIEIRPHNRSAIEAHEMSSLITLIEGSSIDPAIVTAVHEQIAPGETVLVILDSNHTMRHVAAELEAYHDLVSPGSYISAADGIMRELHDVPRGSPEWCDDHPSAAVKEFVERHPEFTLEQPSWPFNESELEENLTYWPDGWLRRN